MVPILAGADGLSFRSALAALLAGCVAATAVAVTATPARAAVDEYDLMREKWKASLDGGPALDTADPLVAAQVAARASNGQRNWSTMDTTPVSHVWPDLTDAGSDAVAVHHTYTRLRDMTLAWSTKGSALYQNPTLRTDIITALDWVHAHWYNASTPMVGNWWEWQLAIPQRLGDIMSMLYPELGATRINNYTSAIDHFSPWLSDPDWRPTNANAADALLQQMLCAVMLKSGTRLSMVRDRMGPLFDYVTAGNGFYPDGSYVDHESVAYSLSYGSVFLSSVSNLLFGLAGSPWAVVDPGVANFYRLVYRSYEPLIYKGAGMDLVRGRAVSRETFQDHAAGHDVMASIVRVSTFAPPPDAADFRAMVKYWATTDTHRSFLSGISNLYVLTTAQAILADSSVGPRGEPVGHYPYNTMDRTVHRRPDYAFAISRSSKRIRNYELMNGENKKGWYQGDGATYLYNGDLSQFSDDFYAAVNMQRLPGTTLEVRTRYSDAPQYGDGEGQPANSWSGGTGLDGYGVAGMHLLPTAGTNPGSLNALKSWFMFDDEVVALGAGIRTTTPRGRRVETVVDNRKLNTIGNNGFTVNGVARSTTPGWSEDMTGVTWANLQGNVPDADIGYYFPGGAAVQGIRQTRTGTWREHSDGGSTTAVTRHFLTLTAQHGVDPTGGAYSYVLLPNKDSAQTGGYAGRPDIEILANSTTAQAVREKTLGMTGYNFWTDTGATVDAVTSNRRASIMTREVAGAEFEVAISDPTQENTGTITVDIDRRGLSVVSRDPQVTVVQMSPSIKLSVNVNGARGRSFTVRFALPGPIPYEPANATTLISDDFDAQTAGAAPAGWAVTTPAGTTAAVDATPSAADKSVKLTDGNVSGRARISRSFGPQNGIFVTEWAFMEPGTLTNYPYFYLTGGGAAVTLASGGATLRYTSGTGVVYRVAPLTANTWHTVRLVIDVTSQRYDIYLNGELRWLGASFSGAASSVDSVEMVTGYSAGQHTIYIDDVRASR